MPARVALTVERAAGSIPYVAAQRDLAGQGPRVAAVLVPAAVALVLYLATLAPTVYWGDTADLQRAALLLDKPHPTGYPMYLGLGHLWASALPIGDPAWRLNLLSACLTAAAVGAASFSTLRLTGRAAAAAAAGLTLGVTASIWSQAVVAEVYALQSLLVAVLLGAALARPVHLGRLALLFGLGVSHHRMTVLLVPGLLACLSLRRPERGLDARAALAALPWLAVGPAFYALTWWTIDWPDLEQFLVYVLHPGQGNWAAAGAADHAVRVVWPIMSQQLHVAGLALALVGLGWTARRGRPDPGAAASLLGLSWAASLVFLMLYRVGDLYAFAGQMHVVQAILVGAGCGAVAEAIDRLFGEHLTLRRLAMAGAATMAAIALLLQARATYRAVAQTDAAWLRPATEVTAALGHLESRAILATGYLPGETARYLTEAAGVRPDVQVVIEPGQDADWALGLLDVGRPVYVWGGGWLDALADRSQQTAHVAGADGIHDLVRLVRPDDLAASAWHGIEAVPDDASAEAGSVSAAASSVALRPWPLPADSLAEARVCGAAADSPDGVLLEVDPDRRWLRTRLHDGPDADGCLRGAFVVPVGPFADVLPLRVSELDATGGESSLYTGTVRVTPASEGLAPERLSHLRPGDAGPASGSRVLGAGHPPAARPGMSIPIASFWWIESRSGGARPELHAEWALLAEGQVAERVSAGDPLERFADVGWRAPAIVGHETALSVPRRAPADHYDLAVATGADGRLEPVGEILVEDWPRRESVPARFEAADTEWLDGAIRLRGYEVVTHGDHVTVTLAWQAGREVDHDWKVFVHVVAPDGDVIAQHDGVPADGLRWTDGWRPGEVIVDPHRVIVPAVPPGPHALRVGLYDERTGERAPITRSPHPERVEAHALTLATPPVQPEP